jgi:phospho-N-acetylmuramoyl-pentapeptide-transferase
MTQIALAIGLAGVSFLLAVIWGPPFLRILTHFNIGETIRVEGPERHFSKLGTPTMGGIMIIIPVTLMTLLMNAATLLGFTVTGRSILLPLGVLLVFSILGMIDDWEGIRGARRGLGMRARTKFVIQWVLAFIIVIGLVNFLKVPQMYIPGLKKSADLGFWYIPIAMILIVGYSNAMNLTDGLDGLAGLIAATAFVTYGAISLLQGQIFLARFCFILAGATFGFLWFNVHPAELFMGDTGALALGATLAVVALMTGHWILLPIIAIIPTSVTLSVILQVAFFRLTGGRRIFKMTPLHHHFELSGWSETQVVQRFWLIGLLGAMIGMALAIT